MLNEQDIPIDISLTKLQDWLISRRHCPQEWQASIFDIRQKINNAIQDMPASDKITDLLTGSYINYFHCVNIIEILKETEASSMNIFGRYSSQRMKDWQEIIDLYQKDNVYLAEAAQLLVRNVCYEIPTMKKQIVAYSQLQEECLKKEAYYSKSANEMKEKYYASCNQIGIKGECIKNELLSLLKDLPEFFSSMTKKVKNLKPCMDYYTSFLSFTSHSEFGTSCLPMLSHIILKGNTSTYEWRTGEPPEVLEVTKPSQPLDADNGSSASLATDDQIDFGDTAITTESSDDRSSCSPNGDFVHVESGDYKTEPTDQIDFGEPDINWDITVEDSSVKSEDCGGGKVAFGVDAVSVMENTETRNMLYIDLCELKGFLEQRKTEVASSEDVPVINSFQAAPLYMQMQSPDAINKMLHDVKAVSGELTNEKHKHLYLIKDSSSYVDRLAENLASTLKISEKMLESQKAMHVKFENSAEEKRKLEPKLILIINKSKMLQRQIERDISQRYKGRPVNIMGC